MENLKQRAYENENDIIPFNAAPIARFLMPSAGLQAEPFIVPEQGSQQFGFSVTHQGTKNLCHVSISQTVYKYYSSHFFSLANCIIYYLLIYQVQFSFLFGNYVSSFSQVAKSLYFCRSTRNIAGF